MLRFAYEVCAGAIGDAMEVGLPVGVREAIEREPGSAFPINGNVLILWEWLL